MNTGGNCSETTRTWLSPQNDIPLARFSSRRDPATKAVGYDKAAMVFHMIRRNLGEDAFWGALRDVYAQRLFVPTGWQDLRAAFERRGRTSLDRFFREWVDRPGALELSLDRVTTEPAAGGGWTVSGRIRQQEPVYDVDVDLELAVETDLCTLTPTVTLRGADTSFAVHLDEPPRTLALDPAYEVFRRLHPSEMPPSVNGLKGSESVLMVVPEKMDPALAAAADLLPRALGLERVERVPGGDLTPDLAAGRDLLFVGVAPSGAAGPEVPGQVEWTDASFTLNGSRYADPADVFFGVFSHPATVGRVAAVFLPLSGRYTVTVARKIPHYGKYSYLAFTAGQNRDKGVWAVADSPLIFRWPREQRTTEVTQ